MDITGGKIDMASEDWFEYESAEHKMLIPLNNVTLVYYDKKTDTCTVATPNGTIKSGGKLYNDLRKYIEEG